MYKITGLDYLVNIENDRKVEKEKKRKDVVEYIKAKIKNMQDMVKLAQTTLYRNEITLDKLVKQSFEEYEKEYDERPSTSYYYNGFNGSIPCSTVNIVCDGSNTRSIN